MDTRIFDQDEIVILQKHDAADSSRNLGSLILTSKNIIEVSMDYKNATTGYYNPSSKKVSTVYNKYSLLRLKQYKGTPNILIEKKSNGEIRLELFFDSYEKSFAFSSNADAKKWSNAITKAYKERVAENRKELKNKEKPSKRQDKPEGGLFSPFLESYEKIKNSVANNQKSREASLNKCPRCGAELNGQRGEEIQCIYCETKSIIK